MTNRTVTALDLGSTKVVCLSASKTEAGHINVEGIVAVPCEGVQKGVVTDLDKTAMSIDNAVRKLAREFEVPVDGLVVSLSGPHIEGMNAQGFLPIVPKTRTITREDVLQVVNHSRQMMTPPDREQIQAIPREFRIDGQRNIQKPIGMSGSKLEVVTHIICGQSTHLQNAERAVKMTGNRVDQIVVQPLASGLAVLTDEEIELGTAVVDIGGGTTDVAVFSGGAIAFTASIPVGGQHITSDMFKLLKTSPEEAERLKQEYGSAKLGINEQDQFIDVVQLGQTQARPLPRKVVSDIIECRVREMAKLVRQQVEKSGLYGVLPGGIVLTGGGSGLPGIDQVFAEVLGYQRVRIGHPIVVGDYARVASLPAMSTAVGLAKYALEEGDEFAPASATDSWRDRIRSLKTLFARA